MAARNLTQSPCIQVCRMDARNRYCLGCFRTLDEIAQWTRLSEAERREVLVKLPERRREVVE